MTSMVGGRRCFAALLFTLLLEGHFFDSDSIPRADPYSILGVSGAADAHTVKSAYRHMSKKVHPDLACAGQDAENTCRDEANAAMAELSSAMAEVFKAFATDEDGGCVS